MPEAKKFLDYAGLQTFLNNLKYNYAQGNTGYVVGKAAALDSARNVALTGDVTGSTTWDGSGALSIATTVASSFANVIEEVQVNGTPLTVTDKSVNVVVPAATVTDVQTKTASDGSYGTVLDGTVAKIDLSGYALKSEITSVLDFKGTKADQASLPSSGNKTGDVWAVSADNSEYVWTGSAWEKLGPTIDLSGYVQTSRTINNKALSSDITLDGSDIALSSDYAVASTAAAPAAGDSVEAAIGKLQKEVVDANAAATTYAFAEGSTNGAFQVTPTVGGVAGSAQSVAIHGLGSAAYADTTAFVDSSLTPAEAGAQVNVIETVKVNGSALTPDANKAVDITIPAADVTDVQVKAHGANAYASVLDGTVAKVDLSGLATVGDFSVTAGTGDYVTGITYDNTTGTFTETKAAKGSVADNATGLVDGDTVYDYFEAHKADGNVIETVKVNGSALTPDANKAVDVTVPVLDVKVSTDGSTFTSVVDSNKDANIDLSGYATTSDIADFIELSDLSVTAGSGDYVTGISYNSSTGAFTETKAAKGAVADSDTGLVDGDTVYDYIDGMAIPDATINALFPSVAP